MKKPKSIQIRKMVSIAFLAAVASVIMFLEFPMPFMPPFLKLDFSSVPIMLGSFMFGPLSGVVIAAVKALIHLLSTQTAGVGELADFIMTSSFALVGGLIYKYNKSKKGALIAAVCSVFSLIIVAAITNYFILIPFYTATFIPLDAMLVACQKINPNITSLSTYVLWGVIPFNFVKGSLIAAITFVLYKRLSGVIKKYNETQ